MWRVLPRDIDRLVEDSRLIKTGLSADASGINLRYQPRREGIDAYLSPSSLSGLERELRPIAGSADANVLLRTPRGADWILAKSVAPLSVVAADLLSHSDARVARAGKRALEHLMH
jgi:hypothetical protein